MIRYLADHAGPVLVAVSAAAAGISTAKWWLDLRDAKGTESDSDAFDQRLETKHPDPPEAA